MQSMTADMRGLKQAADSGSFAISEAGAQAYVKAIGDALSDLRKMESSLIDLQQATKLGTSPDAVSMSRYNVESANGGAGTTGIVPAVNQLRDALLDAQAAMQKAVENYRNVDDGHANNLKRY
ncbi:hypothetical protein [Actinosynnema sp. NPDC020468]|uniref:hypothetical protein n=1 Tax=Actinosynnema sp. NPDC020468 TaxID=3154488 RepID=UPI0033DCC3E3